jgi:hypothetical protein
MTDNPRLGSGETPMDGVPVWVSVLQAGAIGVVAGLALNALLSMTALQGETLTPKPASPKQCKKQAPAKDAASPAANAPTVGAVTWSVEGVQASFQLSDPDFSLSP